MADITIVRHGLESEAYDNAGTLIDYALNPAGSPILFITQSEVTDMSGYNPQDTAADFGWTWYSYGYIAAIDAMNPANAYAMVDGDTITVNGQVFTVRTTPTEANEIPACDTTVAQRKLFSFGLADAINNNDALNWFCSASINKDFGATDSYMVLLKMKIPGSSYTFTINTSTGNYISAGPAGTINRALTLDQSQYKHFAKIYVGDDRDEWGANGAAGPYTRTLVATLELPLGLDNKAYFDLSEYLRPFVRAELPPTLGAGNTYQFEYKATIAYQIEYGEQYNDSTNGSVVRRYSTGYDGPRWAALGAFPLYDYPNGFFANFEQVVVSGGANTFPLTVFPCSNLYENRVMRRAEDYFDPIYLWVYLWDGGMRYVVTYTYNDGTTSSATITMIAATPVGGFSGLLCMNASYNQLQIDVAESTTALQVISVSVIVQINRGAAWQDFSSFSRDIDQNVERTQYIPILFKNRLGVYELFNFEGVQESDYNAERTNYTMSQATTFPALSRRVNAVGKVSVENKRTYQSGWVDETHAIWLRELVESPEIYTAVEYEGGNYWQALKITESTLKTNTEEELFNLTISVIDGTPINTIQ